MVTYSILEEKSDERVILGLSVKNETIEVLSVKDIFFDRRQAEEFVKLLNKEQLDIVHLEQVIDEYLQIGLWK